MFFKFGPGWGVPFFWSHPVTSHEVGATGAGSTGPWPRQVMSCLPVREEILHGMLSSRPAKKGMVYPKLVGGLEHVLFSHILGIIIPIDVHSFQRGGPTTNQKKWCLLICNPMVCPWFLYSAPAPGSWIGVMFANSKLSSHHLAVCGSNQWNQWCFF